MCGILAVFGNKDKELAQQLSSKMRHRGPDERNAVVTEIGVLCHERLSVVDLHTGIQPIQGSGNVHIIHNGEIYNHVNLHAITLGGKFRKRTSSDSEVIVHLYETFGTDFCNLLDGMFAFVIFDSDKKQMMAARDPIGIKPLYYGKDKAGSLWFASELKSICEICVELDTFPPGHFYTPELGFVRYNQPDWEKLPASETDTTGIRELLEASVEKRLMCDAPYGVLLSGGLDSSLIASIVQRKLRGSGRQAQTFSIGLSPEAPDLIAAARVAAFLNTKHQEVYFSVEEGIQILEKLIWHLESYDVTTIRASTPMYFLSRYIQQQGIKMVLSGEGADEVFGGYLYFYNAPNADAFQEETKRRVHLLHTADVLRADKSTMANGLEAREPMLDKDLLNKVIRIAPELKQPLRASQGKEARIEKYLLRKAFDDQQDPYLPAAILWRQKEQFSDGVGYSWIDGLVAYCETQVSDSEFAEAALRFPYNTPLSKEAFYIRKIFHSHFPSADAARTVQRWTPKWQRNTDPSGRANALHEAMQPVKEKSGLSEVA
jgi:asparagine synthase (glutamine-hydrolysing)